MGKLDEGNLKVVEVTEKDIKRVVKEYVERIFKSLETRQFSGDDEMIDCPQCGSYRSIECKERGWTCLWENCPFRFPEELMPPTPGQLRGFYQREKIREMVDKCLNS